MLNLHFVQSLPVHTVRFFIANAACSKIDRNICIMLMKLSKGNCGIVLQPHHCQLYKFLERVETCVLVSC